MNAQKLSNLSSLSANGRAAYLQNINFKNPVLIILFIPIRILYFLYTPFVWMVRNIMDIFGLFDAVLYIWLSIPVIKKIWKIIKKKEENNRFIVYLFIVLLCLLAMFAVATSNYGTAIRHRCKMMIILIFIGIDYVKIPRFNVIKK